MQSSLNKVQFQKNIKSTKGRRQEGDDVFKVQGEAKHITPRVLALTGSAGDRTVTRCRVQSTLQGGLQSQEPLAQGLRPKSWWSGGAHRHACEYPRIEIKSRNILPEKARKKQQ